MTSDLDALVKSLQDLAKRVRHLETFPMNPSGGVGTGHIIQDEGSDLPSEGRLNFVGSGVTVTDDPDGLATEVAISSGGSSVDPSDSVSDETSWGISPDAGESDDYSRADHTHGTPIEPSGLVTNGDSHDHSGGDGAQIDHDNLDNIGSTSHDDIDSALSNLTSASHSHGNMASLNSVSGSNTGDQNLIPVTLAAASLKI